MTAVCRQRLGMSSWRQKRKSRPLLVNSYERRLGTDHHQQSTNSIANSPPTATTAESGTATSTIDFIEEGGSRASSTAQLHDASRRIINSTTPRLSRAQPVLARKRQAQPTVNRASEHCERLHTPVVRARKITSPTNSTTLQGSISASSKETSTADQVSQQDPPCHTSDACTTARRACARNAADRRYASMTAAGASARSAWGRAYAPTSAARASARNAADRAYAA